MFRATLDAAQELQGHIAAQPGVLGLVDHTHPTATQFLCDFIVGDGLADHVSWWVFG